MATTKRKKKYVPLRYLFLNGELHKVLKITRPKDEIDLWGYSSHRRVTYTYSDVRRKMEKAYTLTEVGKLLNRNKVTITRAIDAGEIERPQYTYGLDDPERKIFQYMMREPDIMAMHAVLANKHAGGIRRKDGLVTPKSLPSARELRAMIRNNTVFYVKTDSGFVPTWKAEDI
jgi:hypothetical protein